MPLISNFVIINCSLEIDTFLLGFGGVALSFFSSSEKLSYPFTFELFNSNSYVSMNGLESVAIVTSN